MKKFKIPSFTVQILFILFAVSLTNCVGVHTHNHSAKTKKVPPGHAKKMSGQKSAKNHAPGHNK
jgi:multisubunit Na+/H+ antiporter MnhG subunit